jgi:hypothetical protein
VVEVEMGQHEVEALDPVEQRAVAHEPLDPRPGVDQHGVAPLAQERGAGGVRAGRDPAPGAEDPHRGDARIVA